MIYTTRKNGQKSRLFVEKKRANFLVPLLRLHFCKTFLS